MKRCTKCGDEKPFDAFSPSRNGSQGRHSWCKSCTAAKGREYRSQDSAARAARNPYRKRQNPTDTSTRECSKCEQRLSVESFGTDRRAKDGRDSWCKRCRAAATKAYREANPDKANAAIERWRRANQAWVSERGRRLVIAKGQPERDRRNAYLRTYRAANPEKTAAKLRAYAQRYPEKTRARCALRRARLKGAAIRDLTITQWEAIKAAYNQRCAYCSKRRPLEMDHVIPLVKGGNHTASNIVPACRSCNGRKWSKDAPTFQPMLIEVEHE